MARTPFSIDLLVALLEHVPEGYLEWQRIHTYFHCKKNHTSWKSLCQQATQRGVGCKDLTFFDTARVSWKDVCRKQRWSSPQIPPLADDGTVIGPTMRELAQMRRQRIDRLTCADEIEVVRRLDQSVDGYLGLERFRDIFEYDRVLLGLQEQRILAFSNECVFDPCRVSISTKLTAYFTRRRQEEQNAEKASALLASHNTGIFNTGQWNDLFNDQQRQWLLQQKLAIKFTLAVPFPPRERWWIRRNDVDESVALHHAESEIKTLLHERNAQWSALLPLCGETLRSGAKAGKTDRMRVIGRSYRTQPAARKIGLPEKYLLVAIMKGIIPAFTDPDERLRIPASTVDAVAVQGELYEKIADFIVLKTRDLAVACGVHRSSMYRRLQRLGISTTGATWGEVMGRWELPATYTLYLSLLDGQWRAIQAMRNVEETCKQAENDRFREQLIAAFPDWRQEQRAYQRVTLLMGDANSAKTRTAIERLITIGEGWYLAPLRLLAYEVYDALNRRGIACNLLTGEEAIFVEGAQITAATIEMFQTRSQTGCVVIDEAHMLADPDRGWAWTRALMEARAEEIFVLGPPAAQPLVERLLAAVGQPWTSERSSRLVPLEMATFPYTLHDLPARTIVVAFSRSRVLALKTDLERMGRTVSIVYGALPPEVRRRQADRFASGETEICVATDAIGMGLNLPADAVCFCETEKYDGRIMRPLTALEVHQIGGRAGRFGLSEHGIITALKKDDLAFLRQRFEETPAPIRQAYVAPSVLDLALLPGRLAARLRRWCELESIPETMQSFIRPADLENCIKLASLFQPEEEAALSLDAAITLIHAPVRPDSCFYWQCCVRAITKGEQLPAPPEPPNVLGSSEALARAEQVIACHDLYLWLACTAEFRSFGSCYEKVYASRSTLADSIDQALLARLEARERRYSYSHIPVPPL